MAEPPAQVTPTGIEPRPRLGGYTLADILIAGTAILISCISLFIATKQSGIMERTLAASSWPLLQIRSSNADTSGHEIINFSVQNVGVGPAIVKVSMPNMLAAERHTRDESQSCAAAISQ